MGIRAVAEELAAERGGKKPAGSEKHMMWGEGLEMHTKPWVRARARRAYWENKTCKWAAVLSGNVLSRQLGGDQGRRHPCPATRGHQERTDCRGAENPDGEVENVNFWTGLNFCPTETRKPISTTKDSRNTVNVF